MPGKGKAWWTIFDALKDHTRGQEGTAEAAWDAYYALLKAGMLKKHTLEPQHK